MAAEQDGPLCPSLKVLHMKGFDVAPRFLSLFFSNSHGKQNLPLLGKIFICRFHFLPPPPLPLLLSCNDVFSSLAWPFSFLAFLPSVEDLVIEGMASHEVRDRILTLPKLKAVALGHVWNSQIDPIRQGTRR